MTRHLIAAALALWGLPVAAQITADDVMSNTKALYGAFGATQSATLTRDGAAVTVSGERIDWQLPLGAGRLSVALSEYRMQENGDGSVTITYPAPFSVSLSGSITGEGSASARVVIGPSDIVTEASGAPGAISYASTTGLVEMQIVDVIAPDMDDMLIDATFTASSSTSLLRVVEDSLIVIFSQSEVGDVTSDFAVIPAPGTTGFDGFATRTTATYGPTSGTLNMGLVPGGADILNLSGALRGGMYISGDTTTTGSTSFTESYIFGDLSDRQEVISGPSISSFRFDSAGILMTAQSGEVLIDALMPAFGDFPIGLGLSEASGTLQFPLLAGPEPQDFAFGFRLNDLRLGPGIWSLFDPGKALDRSPADLGLALSGTAINAVDWLDVSSLEDRMLDIELPLNLTSLNVTDLTLSALGAMVSGQAALTFDNSETTTYPGFPLPIGGATVEARGINSVIDALGDLGLMPGDAQFGIRMGLGMVTVPGDGEDVLTGRIELTPDGQIIANGQRLR